MKPAALPEELSTQADEVRTRVAKNLSDELKAQRWTRRSAAAELGLTSRYVNSRAAGEVDLSASDLVMFADFLSVPVSRFFETSLGDDTNVTPIGRQRGAQGRRRSIYLLDDTVTGKTLPSNDLKQTRTAPVTGIFDRQVIAS